MFNFFGNWAQHQHIILSVYLFAVHAYVYTYSLLFELQHKFLTLSKRVSFYTAWSGVRKCTRPESSCTVLLLVHVHLYNGTIFLSTGCLKRCQNIYTSWNQLFCFDITFMAQSYSYSLNLFFCLDLCVISLNLERQNQDWLPDQLNVLPDQLDLWKNDRFENMIYRRLLAD